MTFEFNSETGTITGYTGPKGVDLVIPEEINDVRVTHIGNHAFYIDQLRGDEKDILPIAIDGKIDLPNNHLQYAFTWYSLALALLFIFFSWHKSKGLLKFQSNENQ